MYSIQDSSLSRRPFEDKTVLDFARVLFLFTRNISSFKILPVYFGKS